MSKRTRKRVEGLRDLGVTLVRKNPVVDNVPTAKEVYESTYKIAKGKNPPTPRQFLSLGERIDREEARRERARDKWMERRR